jgi:hypothetical protein
VTTFLMKSRYPDSYLLSGLAKAKPGTVYCYSLSHDIFTSAFSSRVYRISICCTLRFFKSCQNQFKPPIQISASRRNLTPPQIDNTLDAAKECPNKREKNCLLSESNRGSSHVIYEWDAVYFDVRGGITSTSQNVHP